MAEPCCIGSRCGCKLQPRKPASAEESIAVRAIGIKAGHSARGSGQSPAQPSVNAPVRAELEDTGHGKRRKAHSVHDADDLVIGCRGKAEEARATMRDLLQKRKWTVKPVRSRLDRHVLGPALGGSIAYDALLESWPPSRWTPAFRILTTKSSLHSFFATKSFHIGGRTLRQCVCLASALSEQS